MQELQPIYLNLAAFQPDTFALGPGKRAAIWVQGCPFHCSGCIAEEWIPNIPANFIDPYVLADYISKIPGLEGITISGGEPMQQAQALSLFLDILFDIMDIGVICFTGYKLDKLLIAPPNPFVHQFMSKIDLLIDGKYVEKLNNGKGLRGSTNQLFNHLTNRYKHIDFANQPRKMEVVISVDEAFIIGVPILRFDETFNQALKNSHAYEVNNEWS